MPNLGNLAAATLSELAHAPRNKVCVRCEKPYTARQASSLYCPVCRLAVRAERAKAKRIAGNGKTEG